MARIVLVADDSPTIQKRAMGILKGEGFEVETVSNGVAAIKRLAVIHPVVVLADVSMPGRDGYEVCDYVKKSPDHSQVPVLLVASDMEPYDSARGAAVGADGIIKKPFEARELISLVVKFAEQFEAATVANPEAPVAPPPKREPTEEIAAAGDAPDNAPTIVQHVDPAFSAPEGVAFEEPGGGGSHEFPPEPPPEPSGVPFAAPQADAAVFPESAFEFPTSPAEEHTLATGKPWDPHSFAPPPPLQYSRDVPDFLKGLEPTVPPPVFVDEPPESITSPPESSFGVRTAIFRAPLEIAEPIWKEETSSTVPGPEPVAPEGMEPKFITEEPADSSETSPDHPHPHEHPHSPNSVSATSLDSFSLDDAAAGQVRFASELPEVVYAAPMEVPPAAEFAPAELVPEVADPRAATSEITPEVVYAEATASEPIPEVVYAVAIAPETTPEPVSAEVVPTVPPAETTHTELPSDEPTPEVVYEAADPKLTTDSVYPEASPFEPPPEGVEVEAATSAPELETVHTGLASSDSAVQSVDTETAASDPLLAATGTETAPIESMPKAIATEAIVSETLPDGVHAEIAPPEPTPEPTPQEAHSEMAMPGTKPESILAEIALLGASVEAIHAKIAHTETVPEVAPHEIASVDSVPEAVHQHDVVPEAATAVASAEPAPAVTASHPAIDQEQVHCIVEKVVLKMAPPILTAEAVEEITKQLTEEIVAEINLESSQPHA